MAGGSSDLLGCVCVGGPFFTSSVSLHSLSTHCHHQFITTLSFFPCRSSTGEKGELSLHPFTSHPFLVNQLLFLYLSPSMFSTCGLTGLLGTFYLLFPTIAGLETFTGLLGDSLSSFSYNCWIGDLHWTSWGLLNYKDCLIFFV